MKTKLILGAIVMIMAITTTASACSCKTVNFEVVSDGTTQWSANGVSWRNAVATWVHPDWPSISGATWIWRTAQTNPLNEYNTVPSGGWYFRKTFTIPPGSRNMTAKIYVDADNSEAVYFNGVKMGQDGAMNKDGPDADEAIGNYTWKTVESYTIKPVVGKNTILIRALNYFNWGTYDANPAGLIFKVSGTYNVMGGAPCVTYVCKECSGGYVDAWNQGSTN